jgi:isopenicillin N synthase-like dioxygenase
MYALTVEQNHGVSSELISKVHNAAHEFFALPEEKKMESFIGNSEVRQPSFFWQKRFTLLTAIVQRFRGFSPLYGEHGDSDIYGKKAGNLSEAYDIGYEIAGDLQKKPDDMPPADNFCLYGGNQWPTDEALPGFRATYLEYFSRVLELSRDMMKIFALSLDLPEDYFDGIVKHPGCISRMMHYPPQPVLGEEWVGIQTHTVCCKLYLNIPRSSSTR